MSPMKTFDLAKMAYQVMLTDGFHPDVPQAASTQLSQMSNDGTPAMEPGMQDMRGLLWSSIDNTDSKDLDQIEFVERLGGPDDNIRLLVGIADVDSLVPSGTPLDSYAGSNCTSVYTGIRTFPMLPEHLSNELTSLMQDADRKAVVVEIVIGTHGETKSYNIHRALVRNKAKLAYNDVANWLDHGSRMPILDEVPGLEAQLQLQDELATRLQQRNERKGALGVQTIEANPVTANGVVLDLEITEHNRARDIIQNFMVTANSAIAKAVHASGFPMIQRIVKKPARWNRLIALAKEFNFELPAEPDALALSRFVSERKAKDPAHFPDLSLQVVKLLGPGEYVVQAPGQPSEGHFGLAVHDYTHATAPNRRYADLVTQRSIKALSRGESCPYTADELQLVAQKCQEREEAARHVERIMRKAAAALLLGRHIGEIYDAIVTGVNKNGTFVRLLKPPAEGRVVSHEEGLDVGDSVKVRLLSTEPQRGFIDFDRVS